MTAMLHVVGGGPAGATLALLVAMHSKHHVVLYDSSEEYSKPCGEAVPSEFLKKSPVDAEVLNEIRRHEVRVCGETLYVFESSSPRWLVIDKSSWVSSLRREAVRAGVVFKKGWVRMQELDSSLRDSIIVDARGPFSNNGLRKVCVARALLECSCTIDSEGVVLDFDPARMGFRWVFPKGKNQLNVGAGYLGVKSPMEQLRLFIKESFGECKIREVKASLVTVGGILRKPLGYWLPVGEAAGMVFPLTGEGIRPSVAHAIVVSDIIVEERHADVYALSLRDHRVRGFIRGIMMQARLLQCMESFREDVRVKLMRSLSRRFYEALLDERILLGRAFFDLLRKDVRLALKTALSVFWYRKKQVR